MNFSIKHTAVLSIYINNLPIAPMRASRLYAFENGADTGGDFNEKYLHNSAYLTAERKRDWLAQVDSDLRRGEGCSNYATLPNLYRAITRISTTVINRIYISWFRESD